MTGSTGSKGSIVLIHGAWHGAWCWDRVVSELEELDVNVKAVELPYTGFDDNVAEARRAIIDAGDRVVVCAHSGGGVTMSQAASGLGSVVHLVYIAAFLVGPDEALDELIALAPTGLLGAVTMDGDYSTVDPERARDLFYGDSSAEDIDRMVPLLRPMHMGVGEDVLRPAWMDVPTSYVVCSNDRALSPVVQRRMAQHAANVVEWPTDHSPFLTRPRELALLLCSYL